MVAAPMAARPNIFWVVDVNGTPVLIDGESFPLTPAADVDQMKARRLDPLRVVAGPRRRPDPDSLRFTRGDDPRADPGYQEGPRIAAVVQQARAFLPVVVVDDGSTDDTAAQAEAAGATVLIQQPNAGKGAALRRGFRHALDQGCEAVVTLDADGQHDPAEIPLFLAAFEASRPELIVGRRDFSEMPPVRRLSNSLGGAVFSAAVGRNIPDNQSGLPAHRSAAHDRAPRQRGAGLRIRGRDDRALHRPRPADRLGAHPHDLRRRAQPYPAVGPLHEFPAGVAATPGGSSAAAEARPGPTPATRPADTARRPRACSSGRAARSGCGARSRCRGTAPTSDAARTPGSRTTTHLVVGLARRPARGIG